MMQMPGTSYHGPFLPLNKTEIQIRDQLKTHINMLAGEFGERNIWHKRGLEEAESYISSLFADAGLQVSEQDYVANSVPVKNIIGEKIGSEHPDKIIIIGAHYDSVFGSPGADDNASGVAAMLTIASLLKDLSLPYTVRFVAFCTEEPPFFLSRSMGSWQYAKLVQKKQENIIGMLSLESIGYYSTKKHSQHYPLLLGLLYPNTADFIGFVGNLSSRKLVHEAIASFRKHVSFPTQGASLPRFIPGVSWSDQWSFWKHGMDAIMITGTALYRNPNYHLKSDLPDTLDYDRMSRVVYGLTQTTLDLAHYKRNA
jgi:Zn-dependent M28 family amino/carboxypeptidase